MVQMIENHAELVGTLVASAADPDRPDHVRLTIDLTGAEPVGAYPNLLASRIGQRVTVLARQGSVAAGTAPGPIRLRASLTGPDRIFADP